MFRHTRLRPLTCASSNCSRRPGILSGVHFRLASNGAATVSRLAAKNAGTAAGTGSGGATAGTSGSVPSARSSQSSRPSPSRSDSVIATRQARRGSRSLPAQTRWLISAPCPANSRSLAGSHAPRSVLVSIRYRRCTTPPQCRRSPPPAFGRNTAAGARFGSSASVPAAASARLENPSPSSSAPASPTCGCCADQTSEIPSPSRSMIATSGTEPRRSATAAPRRRRGERMAGNAP